MNADVKITLDLNAPNAEKTYGVQYDSALRIIAQLCSDGEKWEVPKKAVAVVSYIKSDRIGGYYDTTEIGETAVSVENDRSIITIIVDPQALTTPGLVHMQVNFYENKKRLSTFSFLLEVQKSTINADNIDSKWFGNLLKISGVLLDTTLTKEGCSAEAKAVGNALKKKVNLPTGNAQGENGQLLRTNGDGSTEWTTFGTPSNEQVGTAVNSWLDDHPEATTTVQDDSLTINKFTPELREYIDKKDAGGIITPIYVGDYMQYSTYLPSVAIKHGNYFYTIDAPASSRATEEKTNAGMVHRFNISDNIEDIDFRYETDVGHANSIAYVPEDDCFYVAPIHDYSSGEIEWASYLYKFSSEMQPIDVVETPMIATSVAYDWVTEKFYIYSKSTTDCEVYIRNNDGEWELFTQIDFGSIKDHPIYERYYNQGFAVYNNNFYISSPYGNIVYGKLKAGTSEILGSYIVAGFDSIGRFRFGELEAFQFDPDGHLYASEYTIIANGLINAFVTEIPIGICPAQSSSMGGNIFSVSNATLTLSADTQKMFALTAASIRSLAQLPVLLYGDTVSNISIPAGTTVEEPDAVIRICQSVMVEINGTYVSNGMELFSGVLNLSSSNSGNRLRLKGNYPVSTGMVNLRRMGDLRITGSQALNIEVPEGVTAIPLINPGYHYGHTTTRLKPVSVNGNVALNIGGKAVESYSLYIGTSRLTGF